MIHPQRIPASLKIVAVLFILLGIWSLLRIIVGLANNQLRLDIGVLGLFIGGGLLRFSPGWRTCGLVYLWIEMIALPLAALMVLGSNGTAYINVIGRRIGYTSKGVVFAAVVVMFVVAFWQYRVLTREDVRRLFRIPGA